MSSRRAGDFHLGRVFWFGLLVLGLWASLATASFTQGEASIQGTVSDSSGGAIPGVNIRNRNLEMGAQRNQVTDQVGGRVSPRERKVD